MKMLESALYLAVELGRPVVPIVPRKKKPITRRGLHDASSHEGVIREWWRRYPDANVGLVTGAGLFVLDVDGPKGVTSLRRLEQTHGALPPTVEAITRNGRHIFFGAPDGMVIPPSVGKIDEGLDIRGDRSYVVAPPSIHPSGFVYRWKRGRKPGEHVLADAPGWLLGLIRATRGGGVGGGPRTTAPKSPGGRRDTSASGRDWHLCLSMLRAGAPDDEIEKVLRRTSTKIAERGDRYVFDTIRRAREAHEGNMTLMRAREFSFEVVPARFGKPELRRVWLKLVPVEGALSEGIEADIVVPSPDYARALQTWSACFPDIDPIPLTAGRWTTVEAAWKAIQWKGRRFRVAVRDGRVAWIAAADK